MTNREHRIVSVFLMALGGVGLFISILGVINLSDPPVTKSLFRSLLLEMLITMLGKPIGSIVFHFIFIVISIVLMWLGLRIRKDDLYK